MKYRGYLIDLLGFNYQNLRMKVLSPIEIRVRTMVEDFLANRITVNEFKKELTKAKGWFTREQRTLPKARGKTLSWTLPVITRRTHSSVRHEGNVAVFAP
jgi:hypothetical protein